jgi:holo-[acyl-carrier protein] synthase
MADLPNQPEAARLRTRVGHDLVLVATVADAIERFGDAYLHRIYTEAELEPVVGEPAGPVASRIAARFAAKEALMKVLRTGDEWPDFREIEVLRQPGGWCELQLSGRALARAEAEGLFGFSVSITHDGEYAAATVAALQLV